MFKMIGTGIKLIFGGAAVGGATYVAGGMYPEETKDLAKKAMDKTGKVASDIAFGPDSESKGFVDSAKRKLEETLLGPDPDAPAPKKKETIPEVEKKPVATNSDDVGLVDGFKQHAQKSREAVDKFIDNPLSIFFNKKSKETGQESTPFSWLGRILGGKNDMGEHSLGSLTMTAGVLGTTWFLLNKMSGGGHAMGTALLVAGAVALYNFWDDIPGMAKNAADKASNLAHGGGDDFKVNIPGMDNDEHATLEI